ncbi:MAG: hypothetical protein HQK52_19715 [Oligoflexia bacterium]|nr:hypothetical protein [Oligoflexia bacterium]
MQTIKQIIKQLIFQCNLDQTKLHEDRVILFLNEAIGHAETLIIDTYPNYLLAKSKGNAIPSDLYGTMIVKVFNDGKDLEDWDLSQLQGDIVIEYIRKAKRIELVSSEDKFKNLVSGVLRDSRDFPLDLPLAHDYIVTQAKKLIYIDEYDEYKAQMMQIEVDQIRNSLVNVLTSMSFGPKKKRVFMSASEVIAAYHD